MQHSLPYRSSSGIHIGHGSTLISACTIYIRRAIDLIAIQRHDIDIIALAIASIRFEYSYCDFGASYNCSNYYVRISMQNGDGDGREPRPVPAQIPDIDPHAYDAGTVVVSYASYL